MFAHIFVLIVLAALLALHVAACFGVSPRAAPYLRDWLVATDGRRLH
jgi:hypothetical protein